MSKREKVKIGRNGAAEDLVTEAEAMQILGFSSRMPLYKLRRTGRIGFYLLSGRVVRYSRQRHIGVYLASIEKKPVNRVRRGKVQAA